MDIAKISHWIQIISGIGLFVGIILVLLELEQTENLTRAQLASESVSMAMDRTTAFLGDNSMEVFAKACDPDASLTRGDSLVLSMVFQAYSLTVTRAREVENIGEFGVDRWKGVANSNLAIIFSTQHGRDWWVAKGGSRYEDLNEYAEEFLSGLGPPSCLVLSNVILDTDKRKKQN